MTTRGVRVDDARVQRLRREAAEHDRVRGADARAREHRHDGLGDHRQVDRDPVARRAPRARRARGRPCDTSRSRSAYVRSRVSPGSPSQWIATWSPWPAAHVPVDAVDRGVETAADEPPRERRARPVEDLLPRLVPLQLGGLLRPEGRPVGRGPVVQVGLGVRRSGELGRRVEPPVLAHEVLEGLVAHRVVSSSAGPAGIAAVTSAHDVYHAVREVVPPSHHVPSAAHGPRPEPGAAVRYWFKGRWAGDGARCGPPGGPRVAARRVRGGGGRPGVGRRAAARPPLARAAAAGPRGEHRVPAALGARVRAAGARAGGGPEDGGEAAARRPGRSRGSGRRSRPTPPGSWPRAASGWPRRSRRWPR